MAAVLARTKPQITVNAGPQPCQTGPNPGTGKTDERRAS
jgi:hypothetical protein